MLRPRQARRSSAAENPPMHSYSIPRSPVSRSQSRPIVETKVTTRVGAPMQGSDHDSPVVISPQRSLPRAVTQSHTPERSGSRTSIMSWRAATAHTEFGSPPQGSMEWETGPEVPLSPLWPPQDRFAEGASPMSQIHSPILSVRSYQAGKEDAVSVYAPSDPPYPIPESRARSQYAPSMPASPRLESRADTHYVPLPPSSPSLRNRHSYEFSRSPTRMTVRSEGLRSRSLSPSRRSFLAPITPPRHSPAQSPHYVLPLLPPDSPRTKPSSPCSIHEVPRPEIPVDERHDRFYFVDGSILFSAANRLYRVHRHVFDSSEVLQKLIVDTKECQPERTVSSIWEVVQLVYIDSLDLKYCLSETDIDCFLESFYSGSSSSLSDFDAVKLQHVLRCADRWGFWDIRLLCLQLLEQRPLNTREKMEIAAKHGVESLLLKAYVEVCCDLAVPSGELITLMITTSALSTPALVKLLAAREKVRSHFQALLQTYPDSATESRMVAALREALSLHSGGSRHIVDYIATESDASLETASDFLSLNTMHDIVSRAMGKMEVNATLP